MQIQTRVLRQLLAGTVLLAATQAGAAALDVRLTNLRPTETVRVSVYADAQSWRKRHAPVAERTVAAHDVVQTVRIDGLPPGRYAVRVHQDPNPGGLSEPASFAIARHGWSRNSARFNTPDFERAAVEVGAEDLTLGIHMFMDSRH